MVWSWRRMRVTLPVSPHRRHLRARWALIHELHVEIHGQATPIHDANLEAICTALNATEICYPDTTLSLVYRPIRSSVFPPGQDV